MERKCGTTLSRDESDLLLYYRELPVQEQLSVLESVETRVNSVRRMEELAHRDGINPFPGEDSPWH